MPEKEKKKHECPKKPKELWTCSSWLARELVSQYLQLRVLTQTDSVALYIASGVLEFGREQKSFYESPGKIAKALGLPKSSVKTYIDRLIDDGVIARTITTKDKRKERKWSIPGIPVPYGDSAVSGVQNSTLETERIAGGHNTCPDGDTPSSPEGASCIPEGVTPCSLHLRESEKEKSKGENQTRKEITRAPSCVSQNSSFKKRSKTEIHALLKSFPWCDHQLDIPEGLAFCWANLIVEWISPSGAKAGSDDGSAAEIDPMEVRRAYMTLKQMRIYKNSETVRLWLEWYIKSGGLNKSKYITHFSKSWDAYAPIATQAFVDKMKEENAAWAAELNSRYHREAGTTMPVIQFHKELSEEELQRLRESFIASLPGADAIRDAVEAVPMEADLNNDCEYMQWLATLAKAVPILGPFTEIAYIYRHLDFVRLARADCEGDLEWFAKLSRNYVVNQIEYNMEVMIAEGYASPRMIALDWLHYSFYFDLAPGIQGVLYPAQDTEDEDPEPLEDGQAS